MAYSDFTIPELQRRFGLSVSETTNLFSGTAEEILPPNLANTLDRYVPLARNLNTEKARSELVVAPVLVESKLRHHDRISVFSGLEFNH